jgi:hypothetical protein
MEAMSAGKDEGKIVISEEQKGKMTLLYAMLMRSLGHARCGHDVIAIGEAMMGLESLAECGEIPEINVGIFFGMGDRSESESVELRIDWEGIRFSRLHRICDPQIGNDNSSVQIECDEFLSLAHGYMQQSNFFLSCSRDHL